MKILTKTINSVNIISYLPCIYRFYAHSVISSSTLSSTNFDLSKIPNRIERSSTDILNALSLTVGHDPTAAHYKYHDDPYLIPSSNITKRTFAMSQEAGRKAAKWIRQQEYLQPLFKYKNADPPIETFFPTIVYTENSEDLSENCLNQLIDSANVSDSILVYNLMTKKNLSISSTTKRKLFALICFYNEEEQLPEDLIEERWFSQSSVGKERLRKTWNDTGLAETLYHQLEPKDSFLYCTMISGMCKFYQIERAYSLYQEAIAKENIEINVTTFNSIIQVVNFIKESGDLRWELIQDILTTMANRKIKPNVGTLNSILSAISTISNRNARTMALKTLAEFNAIKISPSLATWYHMLNIFCRPRTAPSHILHDILSQIGAQEFHIVDQKDTYFFVTAMEICRNHLNDVNLANRLDKLLHYKNNYDMIGDSYRESVYYRHYFALLVANEPLDKFMEIYNCLVPNIYTPEPGIMAEILKYIDINGAIELIPQIWSDMVIFDHNNREPLIVQLIKLLVDNQPNIDIPAHSGLTQYFSQIGWEIWEKIQNQSDTRTNPLSWTGSLLGDILIVLCRNNEIDKATQVFQKLVIDQTNVPGTPRESAIADYINLCIEKRQPSRAIDALQYCVDSGFTNNFHLSKVIAEKMTLTDGQLSKITSLVGKSFMEEDKQKEKIVENSD